MVNSISLYSSRVFANLTKDAVNDEKIDEIIRTVFQFFKFAKKDGIQQWINEEEEILDKINEDNREKEDELSLTCRIAGDMQHIKIEKVVRRTYYDYNFRPELIEQLIDHLTPECMRITLTSRQFEGKTDRKEKYYGVHYSYEQIAQESIDRWNNVDFNENLKLHEPNEYIPNDLQLVEREQEEHKFPQLIKRDKLSELWFLQDNKFKTPRAFYALFLQNPFFRDFAVYYAMKIYCDLARESLRKFSLYAGSAGMSYCFYPTRDGLLLEVRGYSEKLLLFLGQILDHLVRFDFSKERFEKIKENYVRDLKNFPKRSLSGLLSEYWSCLLSLKQPVEEELSCVEKMTLEDVESISKRCFSRLFIKMFVHGNVTRKDAESLECIVKNRLIDVCNTSTVWQSSFPVRRGLKLDNNSFYIFHKISEEHHQNLISSAFQIGPWTPAEVARAHLLVLMLHQHFYNKLRTEEQLAYSLSMYLECWNNVLSFEFFIQSSYSPQFLENRIEQFIKWAAEHLSQVTDAEFQTHKQSMLEVNSQPIKRQSTLSWRFWGAIEDDTLEFELMPKILKALEGITKQDVLDLFDEHLVRNPRRLSFRITGTKRIEKDDNDSMKVEQKEADEEIPKVRGICFIFIGQFKF